jgi:hypothetical protein
MEKAEIRKSEYQVMGIRKSGNQDVFGICDFRSIRLRSGQVFNFFLLFINLCVFVTLWLLEKTKPISPFSVLRAEFHDNQVEKTKPIPVEPNERMLLIDKYLRGY